MDSQEEKIYTLEDVARELGVSKTTVSRAISGKGRIGKETRERVQQFIQEHDYRPSVLAKGLAMSKTYSLAVVFPSGYTNTEPFFFQECLNGCTEVAFENNYDILVTITDEKDLTHIQRLVTDRKVDGMILTRATKDSSMRDFLKAKKVPFVVIGQLTDTDIPWVDNNNRKACQEMTEILLMKGIHSLALIGGDPTHVVTEKRYKGFSDAHEKNGMKVDESLVFMGADCREETAKAVESAWKAGAECIVCMDDYIAYMAAACLRELQVSVPEQMKLVSFYDSSFMEFNVPPVTSIRFDTKSLVRNACWKLLELLGEEPYGEQVSLTYQLVLRKSTQ
ncbi:MAG: LacI family transcriptional regulator [Lachnospiraceae bacterium]|nr:LacI family transcriptional regulator [Lachnospiraceae bacterium]